MKRWGDHTQDVSDPLTAGDVLDLAEMAVVVTDPFSNILYWNPFAERLFGHSTPSAAPGRHSTSYRSSDPPSPLSLGIMRKDPLLTEELTKHVLRGGVWEGTFDVLRGDGSVVYLRAQAVPLRHASGAITGIVITAAEFSLSNCVIAGRRRERPAAAAGELARLFELRRCDRHRAHQARQDPPQQPGRRRRSRRQGA